MPAQGRHTRGDPGKASHGGRSQCHEFGGNGLHVALKGEPGAPFVGKMTTFRDCRQCFIFAQEFKEEANIIIESIFVHC